MYLPDHFREERDEEILRVIGAYPLGTLIVHGPSGLDADHVPFLLEEASGKPTRLLAHVARANPLCNNAKPGDEALVIFRAEDAYISPNWYPSQHASHNHVPTWNYQVVHVHGKLYLRDDERFVRGVVARLTRTHEARTGAPSPWKMTDSSPDLIDKLLLAIVGIEIEITKIVGKSKLGQNRDERDRLGAAEELRKRGEDSISTAMVNARRP